MEQDGWDQKRKYVGQWWLPSDPGRPFSAVLRFVEGSPRLKIIADEKSPQSSAVSKAQVILGTLLTGDKVTLWTGEQASLVHLKSKKTHDVWGKTFTIAVLGQHLNGHEDQTFRISSFRLRGLLEFSERLTPVPSSMPEYERPKYSEATLVLNEEDVAYSVSVRIEDPRQLEADSGDPSGAFPYLSGENVRVTFDCEPAAPVSVHDSLLFDMQRLLAFTSGEIIPVEMEWLSVEAGDDLMPMMRRDRVSDVKKYATVNHFGFNMLVTLDVVEPRILLPAWWKAVEELYPATEIICSYNQGTRGVLESSVSSVIALAERLQEVIAPSMKRYPDEEYTRIREGIKKAFAKGSADRNNVLQAVGNRPTLRQKLDVLSESVTSTYFDLMMIDRNRWIQDVTEVRNKLAHTGSHVPRRGKDSPGQLRRVNIETRAIVSLLVLKLMGLNEEVLQRAAAIIGQRLKRELGIGRP